MANILNQLQKMPRRELANMAAEFDPPLVVKKHWNAKTLARKIRDRQLDDEAAKIEPEKTEPPQQPQLNPEFESALSDVDVTPGPESSDGRGGARPGAGRPAGLTNSMAKVRALDNITFPNPAIKGIATSLFDFWALKTGVKEVRLSEQEAENLSLPITRLQEYYFPGLVPEILNHWFMLLLVVREVTVSRIMIIREARKEQPDENDTEVDDEKG